ncbi:MAG: DUF1573 domain-containing protein [Prolixibacteraceae bacterium]
MKKYIIPCLLCLFFACSGPIIRNDAEIRFGEQEHDFGILNHKEAAEYRFTFSNPGETALVVSDVKSSCGCTVAEWTKTPVKPGKSGIVVIRYDAASPGTFRKEVNVYYNGPGSPVVLKINGDVQQAQPTVN